MEYVYTVNERVGIMNYSGRKDPKTESPFIWSYIEVHSGVLAVKQSSS